MTTEAVLSRTAVGLALLGAAGFLRFLIDLAWEKLERPSSPSGVQGNNARQRT